MRENPVELVPWLAPARAERSAIAQTIAKQRVLFRGLRSSLRQKGQVVEYSSQACGCMGTRFAEAMALSGVAECTS